jgi:hypothetical protein
MKYPIRPALLIVSLATLCFGFIVVFSDSDNATRLFVGGDGAYVRTLARQQYDWFGLRPGNLMNFWQGATNVYQYNATGMTVFAGQALSKGSGEVSPVLSYTIAAVFLFISAFLTGSFLSLPFGYSWLAWCFAYRRSGPRLPGRTGVPRWRGRGPLLSASVRSRFDFPWAACGQARP